LAIGSFRNKGTYDIYSGINSKKACSLCPVELQPKARDIMDLLDRAVNLTDIQQTPGLRLKILQGYKQKYSTCINIQYRVTFFWINQKAEAICIEKHYGE
jgi:plasmid maintenance system killer protein